MTASLFNLKNPVHLLATGFGSGLSKVAPGTVGTIAAIPLFYLLAMLPPTAYLIAVGIAAIAGIYICGKTAKDAGVHDHGSIVWDEFVGFWLTMAWVHYDNSVHWLWVIAGFCLLPFVRYLEAFPDWLTG